ncbi:hypothetical protein UFOVP1672_49 [uncultured Caudovirales phage]|uniref:Uncharacterized protein n=1 Tax=uncultured Caudovirales phage TaxID=2100421 RepID=A0A6J5T8H5_9CAUD|nr:hypothetical protein UFOVP988_71 [uncultured Caudovirales phage]CAB4211066.1 hypothetical protein UFOVP1425_71 [uncultured Caudovirales phage]CAB4223436.1 hypothetical protein UFOVP1672_49 [uncultured Caudovirales phage]
MSKQESTDKLETFHEVERWARGHLLIAIGEGKFPDAVWLVVNRAWQSAYAHGHAGGYETAKKEALCSARRKKKRTKA